MVLSCIAYIAVPEDSDYFWWIAYIFYLGAPTAAVIFLVRLFKFYGWGSLEGKVWGLIAAAMLLWCVGEWLWFYYAQVLEIDPYPSAADYLYIAGYGPLLTGFFMKAHESVGKLSGGKTVVVLAIVAAAALIIGLFIVAPIMDAEDYGNVEKGISLTYPLLDIVLLTFGLAILAAFWDTGPGSRGWMLFSVGIIAMTAADIIFSSLDWQDIYLAQMDLLWIASYLLFLAGGVYQYMFHKSLMTR